jgi:hypothetical protein
MALHQLTPIVFFLCATYVIKAIIDALMRLRLLRAGGSEDLLRSILQGEEAQRRHSSLRTGMTLVALALAFAGIQVAGWTDLTPGVVAFLAGAVGAANLAFYALSRRFS